MIRPIVLRKNIKLWIASTIFLGILITCALFVIPSKASGDAGLVALRLPAEARGDLAQLAITENDILDYGSFLWTVVPSGDLAALDQVGIPYQAEQNPYLLTLGGGTFDPLLNPPAFTTAWMAAKEESNPGLHLVQFVGPTRDEWLMSLAQDGLEVVQYIHPYTYVVWGESTAIDRTTAQSFVRWSGAYQPAYAVLPQYRTLQASPIAVRAMAYAPDELDEMIQDIQGLGGTQITISTGSDPVFELLGFTISGDRLQQVASLPGVYSLQPVPTDGGERGEMSNQITAGNYSASNLAYTGYLNWLNRLGLSGNGVVIANVDSGIDQDHTDLSNRILSCTGSTCGGDAASDHGTHTAGIIAGDGSSGITDGSGFLRGLGMAPGANLVEQLYYPTYTLPGGMLTLMYQSSLNGAVISGNSWGPSGSPLGYDSDTRQVDIGVPDADPDAPFDQPLTYVLSIMNGYGGTSSQGTPDEAKNILTIGSTEMQTYSGIQKLNINDLSPNTAHGPALDGRNIPHLVAPGYAVDSTLKDNSYGLKGGTSMSSPHVTGAAALFYERYRDQFGVDPSPALVKAAFLPVAHDLAGNRDADGLLLGHPFDAKQGWGRFNAAPVLDPEMTVLYFDQPVLFDDTGDTWSTTYSAPDDILGLRAMLVWTDAPGHGLGGSTPAWVNNLDLSLSTPGNTYLGNQFGSEGYSIPGGLADNMNNTEGIFLPESPAGNYTLTVTAANLSGDGLPNFGDETDQDFALVVYIYYKKNPTPKFYFPAFYLPSEPPIMDYRNYFPILCR